MTEAKEKLSFDDKLDKIMEAIVFLQQLNLATLQAMDKMLGAKQPSSIVKPNSQLIV